MAKDESKRIRPLVLQADADGFAALQDIADYTPANKDYTVEKIKAALDAMMLAQTDESKAQAALDTARDEATAGEWAFHNLILGVKNQVKAQYGDDSNELQAVGLTKKSEFAKPSARTTPAPAPAKT